MKKITVSFFLIILFVYGIKASEYNYNTNLLSPELKENANAVVRISEITFTVNSINSAKKKVKYAVTVFKKNGDAFSNFHEFYDKQRKIAYINCTAYDANGKLIKKFKKAAIIDKSAVSGYTLYNDNRVKYCQPVINTYPYTVEYDYEIIYHGPINYPIWQPQAAYDISIEKSVFKVIIPIDMNLRYKELNIIKPVEINIDKKNKSYTWKVSNLKAIEKEPYSPRLFEYTPIVFTAPAIFKYEGYKGNMETWKSYGEWTYNLLIGRDELPKETINEVKKLVAGLDNKTDIIKKIYEYVQSKTRYVSIQLGIGGFQPFPASQVDELGYGDCKALTNYTRSLLKAVGIRSIYTEVKAGRYAVELFKDFPSNQTNHVFLCVPLDNDTIWLECTSQTNPFGYTGNFTDDRYVLLITENGGVIARTPPYKQLDNTQFRKANITLNDDGSGNACIQTIYSGLQFNNISDILFEDQEEQKKWYYKNLDIQNINITKFKLDYDNNPIPSAYENLDLEFNNYATLSGKRMFIPLNILNKRQYVPAKLKERKIDIVLAFPFYDSDTIIYNIPPSYHVEHIPQNVELSSQFGEYSVRVTVENHHIMYVRNIKMKKGKFPPEKYNEFIDFLKKIVKKDKMKIVLIKT